MSATPLRLFVYGTLKRGQRSHAHVCGGTVSIEPATISGRLFHLPDGYPMLVVPQRSIIAVGTPDGIADLATQRRWDELLLDPEVPAARQGPFETRKGIEDWEAVEGEAISFYEPSAILSRLDAFEDFRPDCEDTTYIRALVPLLNGGSGHAWTYVAPHGIVPSKARRIHRHWP